MHVKRKRIFSPFNIPWCCHMRLAKYHKIPKISPGAYTFQRLFLRGLFLEGLIFGGAYVRRKTSVSKSIGLACSGKEIYYFCFCCTLYLRANSITSPPRGLYSEGRFNGGFFELQFWGAYIWSGLYMEGLFSEFYGKYRCCLLAACFSHTSLAQFFPRQITFHRSFCRWQFSNKNNRILKFV